MNGNRAACAVLAVVATLPTACATDSSDSGPPPVAESGSVTAPAPDVPPPQITVEGTVSWRTDHVGCAEMVTNRGQILRLVGQVATDHERAVFGGSPSNEYVRITGHAFDALKNATVCGSGIPFVVEKVEPARLK